MRVYYIFVFLKVRRRYLVLWICVFILGLVRFVFFWLCGLGFVKFGRFYLYNGSDSRC